MRVIMVAFSCFCFLFLSACVEQPQKQPASKPPAGASNDTSSQPKVSAAKSKPVSQDLKTQIIQQNEKRKKDFPLHYAAEKGNLEEVKTLIQKGSDVNQKDAEGQTPLHWVAQRGNLDIVTLLVENKADVNAKDNKGLVPLHKAAFMGQLEVGKYLIAKGAEVDVKDANGISPMYVARKMQKNDFIKLLSDSGSKE